MTKEQVIKYITYRNPNNINDNCIHFVRDYLAEKNRYPGDKIALAAMSDPIRFKNHIDDILDQYYKKYHLVELYDKNNRLVKIL